MVNVASYMKNVVGMMIVIAVALLFIFLLLYPGIGGAWDWISGTLFGWKSGMYAAA